MGIKDKIAESKVVKSLLKFKQKLDPKVDWFNNLVEKVKNNRYRIAVATIIVIIAFLIYWYGVIGKIFYPEPPEPTITIVKARIDNIPPRSNLSCADDGKVFGSRVEMWNICGDRFFISSFQPSNIDSIKALMRFGQENVTYSISVITDKKNESVSLYIHSRETKFEIGKKISYVKIVGEGNTEGLYEKNIETSLMPHFEKSMALFEIIPEKDKPISVDCDTGGCEVVEMRFFISQILPEDEILPYKITTPSGAIEKNAIYPKPEPNKTIIYELDYGSGEFRQISVDDPSKTTGTHYINSVKCNPKGKIYTAP